MLSNLLYLLFIDIDADDNGCIGWTVAITVDDGLFENPGNLLGIINDDDDDDDDDDGTNDGEGCVWKCLSWELLPSLL